MSNPRSIVLSSLGFAAFICVGTALLSLLGAVSAGVNRPEDPYGPPRDADWTEAHQGEALDLSDYTQTFEDEFDSVDTISADGWKGPWFAPIHSDVGAAKFRPPTYDPSPFSVSEGILTIRAEKANGRWQAGHMQTADSSGRGFAQKYGYFEIRAKMPAPGTMGAWPAFWLYSKTRYTDLGRTRAEIDIIEYVPGSSAVTYHAGVHLRPGMRYVEGELSKKWRVGKDLYEKALTDGKWHTYGAKVTPDWIIIYFDRKEMTRFPTLTEFRTPLFMLVSNQLVSRQAPRAVSPIDFKVDYVRVWAKK